MPTKQINEFPAVVTPVGPDLLVTQQDADNVTRKITFTQLLGVTHTHVEADITDLIHNDMAFGSRGLVAFNNGATPNTKYDIDADVVILWNPTTFKTVVRKAPASLTNDVGLTGPAVNGRDQSGAFSADSWIYFYWIWNGTTLATLSSLTAPPTGPTFPSGYTHWAYVATIRFNASSQLVATLVRSDKVFYSPPLLILTGGSAVTETAISLSAAVPAIAKMFTVDTRLVGTTDSSGIIDIKTDLRVKTGILSHTTALGIIRGLAASIAVEVSGHYRVELPQTGDLFYLNTVVTGSLPKFDVAIASYSVPNGGA